MARLGGFAILLLVVHSQGQQLQCSNFESSRITLITFDVFAALMDLTTSLTVSVARILPRLSQDEGSSLVGTWTADYGSYAGTVFDETVTGSEPFQWMLNTTLAQIDRDMELDLSPDEFSSLVASWGDLVAWPGTKETLMTLADAGYLLAPLSNGDTGTLTQAMKIFQPEVRLLSAANSQVRLHHKSE
jgi:phosphoglycolate phosphatase-like HAD superfamily hydrolase